MRSVMRRWKGIGCAVGCVGGTCYASERLPARWDALLPPTARKARGAVAGAVRGARTMCAMGVIALDYKLTWALHGAPPGTPRHYAVLGRRALRQGVSQPLRRYLEHTSAAHERCAQRLLRLLQTNQGLYIKVGQVLSMGSQLPIEYRHALAVLRDNAPKKSFSEVEQVFLNDFGASPHDVFAFFEEQPIASASIAQVHRARTHEGAEVAVKVQHPPLRMQFRGDMLAQWCVMKCADLLFEGFDLAWMHPEIEDHLRQELDFEHEGRNAELCSANFADNDKVYIPKILWDKTTKRVLTMEYIDGVSVADVDTLEEMGVSKREAAALAVTSLAEQIMLQGFVHADPHPGNIFIRPISRNGDVLKPNDVRSGKAKAHSFQMVLLDHGLYRQMEESTRVSYCKLWRALIMRDDVNVQRHCAELGVENWQLFACMVLMRPYVSGKGYIPLAHNTSSQELAHMRELFSVEHMFQAMRSMPPELLLVFRNQNYIRALNKELGIPVNRFQLMARMAVKGIHRRNVRQPNHHDAHKRVNPSQPALSVTVHRNWWRSMWTRVKFEANLQLYDFVYWIAMWYFSVFGMPSALELSEGEEELVHDAFE